MVRDPVELFISKFYYNRHGFQSRTGSDWDSQIDPKDRNKTIEQCIENEGSDPTCLIFF